MSLNIKQEELRHSITIERYVKSEDEDRRPIKIWEELYTTRAKVTSVSAREYQEFYATTQETIKNFYVRCRRDKLIDNKDRIIFRGEAYLITYVNNYDENNEWITIKAVKVK